MSQYHLEFEKPIIEQKEKIAALQSFKERSSDLGFDPDDEIACLRKKCEKLTQSIYADLGAWEIVRLNEEPAPIELRAVYASRREVLPVVDKFLHFLESSLRDQDKNQ